MKNSVQTILNVSNTDIVTMLMVDHKTGMTEGAVHNYCNAVMWQYENR